MEVSVKIIKIGDGSKGVILPAQALENEGIVLHDIVQVKVSKIKKE